MHAWVRRWEVTVSWEKAADSPLGVTRHCVRVDTPGQLRRLVEAARADRLVTGLRYESVRELMGERPATCGKGHDLRWRPGTSQHQDWLQCDCGGHLVHICLDCGDRTVDPPMDPDCVPPR